MINIVKQNDDIAYNLVEFVCDDVTDIANLRTDIAIGSSCLVISTSDVYMLNGKKEWVKL